MPTLSPALKTDAGAGDGTARGAHLSGADTAPPAGGDDFRQVVSSGVTGLADLPAFIWQILSGMGSFGAEPLVQQPGAAAPPDVSLPAFDPKRVAPSLSLLGLPELPEMKPNLANETVRAATGLLSGGTEARIARSLLGAAPAAVTRVLKAFEVPKPGTALGQIAGQAVGTTVVEDPEARKSIPAPLQIVIPPAAAILGAAAGHVAGATIPAVFNAAGAADRAASSVLARSASDPDALDRILHYSFDPGAALENRDAPGTGFQTTAEIAGDTGLINLERTLRNPAETQAGFVANDIGRTTGRGGLIDEVAPPPGQGTAPGIVSAELQRQRDAQLRGMQGDLTALGPGEADPRVAGQRLQEPLVAARQASEQATHDLFASIDPAGTTAIPTAPIRDAVRRAARSRYVREADYPADLRAVLAQLEPDTLSIGDLQSIRGGLRTSDQRLQGVFSEIGPQVVDAIQQAANTGQGITRPQADLWNQWRQAYGQHQRTFGEGPVAGSTDINFGRPEMGPASVPGQFFNSGAAGADSMAAFNQAVTQAGGQAPALTEAMRSHVVAQLGALVGDDGTIPAAALTRFLRNYGPAIAQLPADLRAQLGNVERANRLVLDAGGTPTNRGSGIARLFLDGRDPRAAINSALDSTNAVTDMRDLVSRTRQSPEAFQQLRRAVLENWMDEATSTNPLGPTGDARTMSAAKGTSWWDRNRATLAASNLFSNAELNRLNLLQGDILSRQRVNVVGRAVASNTGQNLSNASMLDTLMAGSAVPEFLKPVVTRFGAGVTELPLVKGLLAQSQAKGRARLAEAMLDPRVAADLLRRADPTVLERLSAAMPALLPAVATPFARGLPALAASSTGARRDR